jgi:hypothetical protein
MLASVGDLLADGMNPIESTEDEFSGATTAAEMRRVCESVWSLVSVDHIGDLLRSA